MPSGTQASIQASTQASIQVSIMMGSESDLPVMKDAAEILSELGIASETVILSAHRAPEDTAEYARSARGRGIRVIIAGAGGAAHLPGVVASLTELPVIGVPVPGGPLQGQDALYSIVQMPRGVPVATVAIGNAYNAGILAAQILAAGGSQPDPALTQRLVEFKRALRQKVLAKAGLPKL
ncbi:MAG: 5-(carboxyamino)imidazole ribonucleotide mutase [Oligoflexia bacterium]|nr:5-(carboxyamino)imidazole ribonucleotide mutase [Oligoflexia bacterium]